MTNIIETPASLISTLHYAFKGLTPAESAYILDQVAAIIHGHPKPEYRHPQPQSNSDEQPYVYRDSTSRTFNVTAVPGPIGGPIEDPIARFQKTWHLVVDTGTDNINGRPQIIYTHLPECIAKQTAVVLRKIYEEAVAEATNRGLESKASDTDTGSKGTEKGEEPKDAPVGATNEASRSLQLSSRVSMVKGKARSITINKKGKKVANQAESTVAQGNAAPRQDGQPRLNATHQKQEASGHPGMTSAIAGPALHDGDFGIFKLSLYTQQPLPETIKPVDPQAASTSSAAILREEVQRLAAANPSMVSTIQCSPPQAIPQSKKRDSKGGTTSQSVLAVPESDAQTVETQRKQAQPGNQPLSPHSNPGGTTPTVDQSDEYLPEKVPVPPPMWHFTGESGGPPTLSPRRGAAASNEGQRYPSTYSDDEFLHSYATFRHGTMEAMTDYMERSLMHPCRRTNCLLAPGIQVDGTLRFYRPPPEMTLRRHYAPGFAEGPLPPRRRQEGRKVKKSYYD